MTGECLEGSVSNGNDRGANIRIPTKRQQSQNPSSFCASLDAWNASSHVSSSPLAASFSFAFVINNWITASSTPWYLATFTGDHSLSNPFPRTHGSAPRSNRNLTTSYVLDGASSSCLPHPLAAQSKGVQPSMSA